MTPIKVVCGIIWKDGKILIARRKAEKSMGGYWEFPGGKLEKNEHPEKALIRELEEEIGMKVNILQYIGSKVHHYPTFSIELMAYHCDFIDAAFQLADHDETAFVNPKELKKYKITPADLFIVDALSA